MRSWPGLAAAGCAEAVLSSEDDKQPQPLSPGTMPVAIDADALQQESPAVPD